MLVEYGAPFFSEVSLRSLQGSSCLIDTDCGTGTCTSGACMCPYPKTGPNCLSDAIELLADQNVTINVAPSSYAYIGVPSDRSSANKQMLYVLFDSEPSLLVNVNWMYDYELQSAPFSRSSFGFSSSGGLEYDVQDRSPYHMIFGVSHTLTGTSIPISFQFSNVKYSGPEYTVIIILLVLLLVLTCAVVGFFYYRRTKIAENRAEESLIRETVRRHILKKVIDECISLIASHRQNVFSLGGNISGNGPRIDMDLLFTKDTFFGAKEKINKALATKTLLVYNPPPEQHIPKSPNRLDALNELGSNSNDSPNPLNTSNNNYNDNDSSSNNNQNTSPGHALAGFSTNNNQSNNNNNNKTIINPYSMSNPYNKAYLFPSQATPNWIEDKDEAICTICLIEFEAADHVRVLPCHHCYHSACIDEWFECHDNCPLCKACYGPPVLPTPDSVLPARGVLDITLAYMGSGAIYMVDFKLSTTGERFRVGDLSYLPDPVEVTRSAIVFLRDLNVASLTPFPNTTLDRLWRLESGDATDEEANVGRRGRLFNRLCKRRGKKREQLNDGTVVLYTHGGRTIIDSRVLNEQIEGARRRQLEYAELEAGENARRNYGATVVFPSVIGQQQQNVTIAGNEGVYNFNGNTVTAQGPNMPNMVRQHTDGLGGSILPPHSLSLSDVSSSSSNSSSSSRSRRIARGMSSSHSVTDVAPVSGVRTLMSSISSNVVAPLPQTDSHQTETLASSIRQPTQQSRRVIRSEDSDSG